MKNKSQIVKNKTNTKNYYLDSASSMPLYKIGGSLDP